MDEYLQQGMYGPKELNPDERRRFLGTLRERVVIALKQEQVREAQPYKEVEDAFKSNKGAHLFLNGNMDYSYISKYTKLANKYSVEYTIVTNQDYNSELGMVFAYDHAIDKEEIYVLPKSKQYKITPKTEEKGLFSKIKNVFKK